MSSRLDPGLPCAGRQSGRAEIGEIDRIGLRDQVGHAARRHLVAPVIVHIRQQAGEMRHGGMQIAIHATRDRCGHDVSSLGHALTASCRPRRLVLAAHSSRLAPAPQLGKRGPHVLGQHGDKTIWALGSIS